jgi:hypothetical protein
MNDNIINGKQINQFESKALQLRDSKIHTVMSKIYIAHNQLMAQHYSMVSSELSLLQTCLLDLFLGADCACGDADHDCVRSIDICSGS